MVDAAVNSTATEAVTAGAHAPLQDVQVTFCGAAARTALTLNTDHLLDHRVEVLVDVDDLLEEPS